MGSGRTTPTAALIALGLGLGGCTGILGGGDGGGGPGEPGTPTGPNNRIVKYACDEGAAPREETPLRRLSRRQLVNTFERLIADAAPSAVAEIQGGLAGAYARIPEDQRIGNRHGGLSRLDQTIQQQFSDAVYDLSVATAAALTSSRERIAEVMGACANDGDGSNDATCLADFVRRFGAKAFRAPLTEDDVTFFTTAGEIPANPTGAAEVATVIGLILTSPEVVYQMEHGVDDGPETGLVDLSAYELAARVSYTLWDEPPDAELWAAAADGTLRDATVYEAQVKRALTDPKAQVALGHFFQEWLQLDDTPELANRVGEPLFDAFAGSLTPTPELREAMIDDVVMAAQAAMASGKSLSEFMSDTDAFTDDPALSAIYGDGSGRVGLITRPAFLVTGTSSTRPVHKGLFIRTGLLCDEIPPPPADADLTPPVATADLTTRESLEARTEAEGSVCAGCHATSINHLGYATENFDALGRVRLAETLFDDNAQPTMDKPINTVSTPQVVWGDETESTGAADLMAMIDASGKPHSCLARDFFRFTFERLEDEARDGCVLADLEEQAQLDRPLVDVFAHLLLQDDFRKRRFE